MKKIGIIIRREYLSRVRKRSFIVMTILGPLLMAAMMIVPVYIATKSDKSKTIAVIDTKGIFYNRLTQTDNIKFEYPDISIDSAKVKTEQGVYDAILYLPDEFNMKTSTGVLFFDKPLGITVESYIENTLTQEIIKFQTSQCIDENVQKYFEKNIKLTTTKLNGAGLEEKSNTATSTVLGIFAGILIYMFIFLFGTQVLRGVIEEKTSRIVEVIVSSVKPVQLMMGKIIGIALVGLTQFILWIILTFGIVTIVQTIMPPNMKIAKSEKSLLGNNKIMTQGQAETLNKANSSDNEDLNEITDSISSIDFGLMISMFLFYFLFGYLLYAALFAAVGSAVDSEADTQQFMLPITIPLIFAIVMSQFVINNPEGPVAFWLSIIPLTSPIIMMVRIPFGVPIFDIVLSFTLLIGGFLFCTWFAAKIYRTGILMYGKKVSYKELWKWLTYKS
jgi:ABC-2 type transport system permease protein